MAFPLQISLHGIARSPVLREAIREKAEKLARYYTHIVSCRIALEHAGHKRNGSPFTARIDLKVPGAELVVNREHDQDLQVALRDAFDALRRRLEDYARERRGD